ncbi:MAG: hypothetical protein ACK56F_20055, partial [bacterium]
LKVNARLKTAEVADVQYVRPTPLQARTKSMTNLIPAKRYLSLRCFMPRQHSSLCFYILVYHLKSESS